MVTQLTQSSINFQKLVRTLAASTRKKFVPSVNCRGSGKSEGFFCDRGISYAPVQFVGFPGLGQAELTSLCHHQHGQHGKVHTTHSKRTAKKVTNSCSPSALEGSPLSCQGGQRCCQRDQLSHRIEAGSCRSHHVQSALPPCRAMHWIGYLFIRCSQLFSLLGYNRNFISTITSILR